MAGRDFSFTDENDAGFFVLRRYAAVFLLALFPLASEVSPGAGY